MRFKTLLAALVASIFVVPAYSSLAVAGGSYPGKEHAYADSYGNLIVHSPAGYKRILVGKGNLAHSYAAVEHEPKIVYLEDEAYRVRNVYTCRRTPAVVQGRSYMYGLPENVAPVIIGPCK